MTPAFEQFARSKGWPTWRKPDGKTYIDTRVQFAAEAWQAREVPAGFVVVPVEPNEEMCRAAVIYANGNAVYKNVAAEALKIEESIYGEAYAAMLAAAPQQPASVEGGR